MLASGYFERSRFITICADALGVRLKLWIESYNSSKDTCPMWSVASLFEWSLLTSHEVGVPLIEVSREDIVA